MNFINFGDISSDALAGIVDNSLEIKKNAKKYRHVFKDMSLYMLFEKTSTRTAISFDRAMVELGGTVFNQRFEDSNFGIGTIQDEVRYVGRNFDIIMARMKSNESINEMAKHSSKPVINGCCNKYHPCQAMGDMMTVKELFGSYNVKMLYIGVWNNVFNSLVESLPKLGGKLYGLTPIINQPTYDQIVVDSAESTGNFIQLDPKMSQEDLKNLIKDMDIVYTDTWVDMEFINNPDFSEEKEARIAQMLPYQVNEALLEGSSAKVMHDMPIHPDYEISRETVERHINTILLQSENRRHVEKGILIEVEPRALNIFQDLEKTN